MDERSELEASLRTTLAQVRRGYERAREDGRHHDALLLAEMRASTEFALRVLTNPFWDVRQPRVRNIERPGPVSLSDRQIALLDAAMSALTQTERRMVYLCLGHNVPIEAARVALGLSPEEAETVTKSIVAKLKRIQRQVLGGGGLHASATKDTLPVSAVS